MAQRKAARMPWDLRLARTLARRLGPLAPGLALRAAYPLWFRTRRGPTCAEATELTGAPTYTYLTEGGVAAGAYVWPGTGQRTLLIHGWNGCARQMASLAQALHAAGMHVIAIEASGHGRSAGRTSSVAQFTAAIRLVCDKLGPCRYAVAHSFGVQCLFVALRDGLPLDAAVAIGTPPPYADLAAAFARRLGFPATMELKFRRRLESNFGRDVWTRFSVLENAPHLCIPGLIIHDRHDGVAPFATAEALSGLWKGAILSATEGLGHQRILRDASVHQRIVGFLCSPPDDSRKR